jgi:hypothetical protein
MNNPNKLELSIVSSEEGITGDTELALVEGYSPSLSQCVQIVFWQRTYVVFKAKRS